MALRTILTDKSPTLRKISREQVKFDDRLWILLDDLKETMEHAMGAGLAAPQVGILRRVAVIDVGEGVIELINPVIISTEGEREVEEGCLSVVGKWGKTLRPEKVHLKAFDRHGEEFEIHGEELLALALIHETEHLDGKLYTDIIIGDLWDADSEEE